MQVIDRLCQPIAMIATHNPLIDPLLYVGATKGFFAIPFPTNMHTISLKTS
jgi:hypothetical protein